MSEAICIKDLSFSFKKGETLLSHVDLDIMEGEKWAVIGPNGSGKSTLIELVLGLLKPDSGTVTVFGKTPKESAGAIGYVPQNMKVEDMSLISVFDFVMSGDVKRGSIFKFSDKSARAKTESILSSFGLSEIKGKPLSELSGGFLQRAQVARALISDPKLLVLDESLSSMDPRKENDIFDLIESLRPDLTIILVTHDVGFVSRHIGKVACLSNKLVVHRTEALSDEVIEEVFGGQVKAISHKYSEEVKHKH